MAAKSKKEETQILGFLGVGLDSMDEHKRITRSAEFLLLGGSEETHENMQDIAIRFAEALKNRGKRLPDASLDEVIDLLHKAADQ